MAASVLPPDVLATHEWRSATAAALRLGLTRNVIAPWFPRSIDGAHGGFTSGFNWQWRPVGPQHRLLEFQARQTRSAARLGVALPAEASWHDITNHGLRYLDRVQRDRTDGGWFSLITRGGLPLLGGTKHALGTAYLISCGVEANRLTGQALPLAIAHEAFSWLETALHDAENGGYHGWATREGRPIMTARDLPHQLEGRTDDHLGHEIGAKDIAVHSALLEAFALLAAVSPDARVKERLTEVYSVLTGAFITSGGGLRYVLRPSLTPVPGPERYGYSVQTGYRLEAAAQVLGRSVVDAKALAQKMLNHAIEHGWDHKRGGFFDESESNENSRKRHWWVQTEAAKLLLSTVLDDPTTGRYRALLQQLLEVIERDFIDRQRGGWEMLGRPQWPRRLLVTARGLPKSDIWKDASHEADMYLTLIRMLRGLEPYAPID